MHPVHPAMMAEIAADQISDRRCDAIRDQRAKSARRGRRPAHRFGLHRRHSGASLRHA
jgi:hypothetical protein